MVDDDRAPHPADTADQQVVGRTPPHNLDAEASLLGAMLLNRDAIAEALQIVTTSDFYKPAHAHVFDAILSLYAQGEPADPVTVAEELKRAGLIDAIGGPGALIDLESSTPATSNAAFYAKIVEERAMMRGLIGVGGEVAQLGYDIPDDVDAALDTAEHKIFKLADRRVANSTTPLAVALDQHLADVEVMYDNPGALSGVRTGFKKIDDILGGLQDGALYVIGARPAVGKTALALGIARGVAQLAGMPVLLFSLEMSTKEVTQRLLCAEAEVDSKRIRTGQLTDGDWKKISNAIGRIGAWDIDIVDDARSNVLEMRAIARRQQAQKGSRYGAIIVDYLQLMAGQRRQYDSRNNEVSEISRGLKILARDLDVPVIALSQLNRAVEARQEKRPTLADLRDSGSVEQDADVVMFIYREAMYDRAQVDDGTTEVIVAKHRNGPTGTAKLAFRRQYAKFSELADL